jgi:hypothetical protein
MTDQEAIARRAYELYLERGSTPGHELEDWLTAEAELSGQSVEASAEQTAEDSASPATPARRKRDAGGASSKSRSLRP